jgi:hypothetical protein
MNEYIEVIS